MECPLVMRNREEITVKKELRYLPFFLVLTCIYFYDVFLKGAVLAVGDGFDEFFPLMITMSRQYKDLSFPFWNPYMFSGFPLLGAMQAGALYPPNILFPLLFSPALAFNLDLMLHYSLAGFFTFLYARQVGLGVFPSLVSGTVFSLLGYLPAHLMHPSIITSGTWIPLLLFFYERIRLKTDIRDVIYASFVVALQIFAGHPQICFYTYLMLIIYLLFHLFYQSPSTRLRFVISGLFPLALGLLLALPQLWATYELASIGARVKTTYEFFSSYAFPVHMIPTFLFPFFYFFGGGRGGEEWGPVPGLGQEAFIGALPFLLAIVVLVRWKKDPNILFWGFIAVLAFVLALGDAVRPLNQLLFELPGYNSFRGPSKHILEMSLALSILAGFGVSIFEEEKERRFQSAFLVVMAAVITVSLVSFAFFHGPIREFLKDSFSHMHHFQLHWDRSDIPEKALSMEDPAIYVPILIMSVYLACIYALMKAKKRGLRNLALSVIFLVIFAEALYYKADDLPKADTIKNYNADLYAALASDQSGRTVFFTDKISLLPAMSYGIRLAEGYDPLAIGDYIKMLPPMFSQSPNVCRTVIMNNSLLSMLNVKHVVADNLLGNVEEIKWYMTKDGQGRPVPLPPALKTAPPADAEYLPVYRKVASFPLFSLYENTLSLPRAYPVSSLKPAGSIEELMQLLFSFQLAPWREAVVSAEDLSETGSDGFSPGDLKFLQDSPDKIVMATRFTGRGFVVLADQFYPGWEAFVDGGHVKIYRTNGVLRGVVIPAGEHTLVFRYFPRRIYISMLISSILFLIMLCVLIKRPGQRLHGLGG